jgi:uncharacterized protein YkwD
MRTFITIILLFLQTQIFCQTNKELLILYEINKIRSNPKSYISKAEEYINTQNFILKKYEDSKFTINTTSYSGNSNSNNDMVNVKKTTGKDVHIQNIKAAEDLINVLDTITPMDTLMFDSLMYKITKSHGEYLKSVDKTGHYGPKGQTVFDRFNSYEVSENCGTSLIGLMVDSGIPGFGHRYNILNPKWNYISIYYIIDHPSWGDSYMIQNFKQ